MKTSRLWPMFLLVLAGCGNSANQPVAANGTGTESNAVLSAAPNPVPAGTGQGTTTLTWDAGTAGGGEIYVSRDGREEKLFAKARKGSKEIPWIQSKAKYEFRLYGGKGKEKLLKSVTVTREQ